MDSVFSLDMGFRGICVHFERAKQRPPAEAHAASKLDPSFSVRTETDRPDSGNPLFPNTSRTAMRLGAVLISQYSFGGNGAQEEEKKREGGKKKGTMTIPTPLKRLGRSCISRTTRRPCGAYSPPFSSPIAQVNQEMHSVGQSKPAVLAVAPRCKGQVCSRELPQARASTCHARYLGLPRAKDASLVRTRSSGRIRDDFLWPALVAETPWRWMLADGAGPRAMMERVVKKGLVDGRALGYAVGQTSCQALGVNMASFVQSPDACSRGPGWKRWSSEAGSGTRTYMRH